MPSPSPDAAEGSTDSVRGRKPDDQPTASRVLWLLTTSAVTIEIGLVVALLHAHAALWLVGAVLAAYHAGYLVANVEPTNATTARRTGVLSVGTILLLLGIVQTSYLALAAGALIFSASTQHWRRQLKQVVVTRAATKNGGKAIGMLTASAFALPTPGAATVLILVLCSILAISARSPYPYSVPKLERPTPGPQAQNRLQPLLLAEALHHAHYFAYAYTFWVLASIPTWLIGPSFIIGWIGYFIAERSLRERHHAFAPWVFIAGHLACLGALAIIASRPGTTVTLVAWAITGIGGGTAYMLGNAHRAPSTLVRERFEDGGHVAGCVLAAVTAGLSPVAPVIAAAGLAAATCAAMLLYIIRTPEETCT